MEAANLRALLLRLKEQLQIYITAFCTLLYIDLDCLVCELEDVLVRILASHVVCANSPLDKDLLAEIARLIVACQQIVVERKSFESTL